MDEMLSGASKRWEGMRESLAVCAAGHPSPRVVEIGNRLLGATSRSLASTSLAVRAVDDTRMWEQAFKDHAEAVSLANDLMRLVSEDPPELRD
jgi:hypothetical protein